MDNEFETPTKKCEGCNGKGWVIKKTYITAPIHFVISSFEKHKHCDGDGYVYLTDDEIAMENECRKFDEHEKRNDN